MTNVNISACGENCNIFKFMIYEFKAASEMYSSVDVSFTALAPLKDSSSIRIYNQSLNS